MTRGNVALQIRRRAAMRKALWLTLGAATSGALAAEAVAPPACGARSGGRVPQVVELYTSEGCNSCPPADRWLTTLKDRTDVLAAAFHVDYWDRLGWADRFASPRFTQRQRDVLAHSGAGFAYTPQVLVDGHDWRHWPRLPPAAPPAAPATVRLQLERDRPDSTATTALVQPLGASQQQRLTLWWALLEDGHVTAVPRGENAGTTLRHDRVVRAYGSVPAWTGPQRVSIPVVPRADPAHPSRLLAVVTDATSGATLQAVQLACP